MRLSGANCASIGNGKVTARACILAGGNSRACSGESAIAPPVPRGSRHSPCTDLGGRAQGLSREIARVE